VVVFIEVWALIVPKDKRYEFWAIVNSCASFVLWVVALICYALLTNLLFTSQNNFLFQVLAFAGFGVVPNVLILIPDTWLFGVIDVTYKKMWDIGFYLQYQTFILWVLPRADSVLSGGVVIATIGAQFANYFMTYRKLLIRANKKAEFEELKLKAEADAKAKKAKAKAKAKGDDEAEEKDPVRRVSVSKMNQSLKGKTYTALLWSLLPLYKCLAISAFAIQMFYTLVFPAWNKDKMYILEDLNDENVVNLFVFMGIEFGLGVGYAFIVFWDLNRIASKQLAEFTHMMFAQLFWHFFILIASTALACGACMVMKHDGMDLTFQFNEWEFEA
jgi:hypothetical protein